MGLWDFLSDITGWFTPKQRVRRIKDKVDKLEKERKGILKHEATEKSSGRLLAIDRELSKLNRLLQNST